MVSVRGHLPMLAFFSALAIASAGNFHQGVDITWGDGRGRILRRGQLLTLSLDKYSGSGFQSKEKYHFGRIDMNIKLIGGDSAGTVTAFYVTSEELGNWNTHDEIDFEFLGNLSGDPYTLHTNVYANGTGGKEMQFKLWFDPTKHFHNYTILWNPKHVILMVDGVAIRDFKNLESKGVAFPSMQAMRARSSLWAAEDWATRGGLVKTDWSKAPFVASFRDFDADACVLASGETTRCGPGKDVWWNQELDAAGLAKMRRVQKTHMIYNYCADLNRFPQGLPLECSES